MGLIKQVKLCKNSPRRLQILNCWLKLVLDQRIYEISNRNILFEYGSLILKFMKIKSSRNIVQLLCNIKHLKEAILLHARWVKLMATHGTKYPADKQCRP